MLGHFAALRAIGFRSRFYQTTASRSKSVPRSLLQRQAKRRGDIDSTASSQLIVTSFKDIFSFFNPSGLSQEDDDTELAQNKEAIIDKIEHGELRNLYLQRFAAVPMTAKTDCEDSVGDLKIPTQSMLQVFPQLSQQDRELIEVSLSMIPVSMDWKEISLVQKQMLFYMGYGSYGPRNDVTFVGPKPEDFTWQGPAKVGEPNQRTHRLPKSQITHVWTCTPSRRTFFDGMTKRLDPGTLSVAFIGLIVAVCATLKEYLQRQDDNAVAEVAQFEEVETSNA
ncbi:LAFA_0C04566g1_1 [Lachancea sp. 'fantastica']|nr:LAFA_0C04566g1_1 [Lachancea sp. 'fantastica']